MVYKEIILCDVCGKQIERRHPDTLLVIMHKDVVDRLGLKGIVLARRGLWRRRKFLTHELDICSKACLVELLERIKKAMEHEA